MSDTEKRYMTLQEVCEELSVTLPTGRNWLRLGKLNPQVKMDGLPLFTQEYVSRLKNDLMTGKNRALKNRRNKKFISGSSVYESYITAASVNLPKIRHLWQTVCSGEAVLADMELRALLAECALQLILQREGIDDSLAVKEGIDDSRAASHWASDVVSPGTNLLFRYIRGEVPLHGYEFLIDDLLPDKAGTLFCMERYPQWFAVEYQYEKTEDILGLLYISCKNLGSRKSTGAYYTPTSVVKKLVGRLFEENRAESKTVFDPCCGTGNFLLQLPEEISLEHIYGSDIDEVGVCITRINLALKFGMPSKEILYEHIRERDYLLFGTEESFDYIIGNPPWGYEFTEQEKQRLREKYLCAQAKNIESYDVFTEQAISNLKCGGVLSFVLPESILNVRAHMPVRSLLMEGSSVQYLEFLGEVFGGVNCPSIILQVQHDHRPLSCVGMTVKDGDRVFTIAEERRVRKECFNFTVTDEEYRILQKIEHVRHKVTLAGHAAFALGIVTGNNKKYISHEKTAENEAVLKGADIHKFRYNEGGSYIVCKPELFQQTAPLSFYRAPQKLLYRFICSQLVFAYDDRQTLSLNSCNVVIPQIDGLQMKYILAVLNSRIAQFYFKKSFQSMKVLRSHIEQIPIPAVGEDRQQEIIHLAERLIAPPDDTSIEKDYEVLDNKVANIFGLSHEEYAVVKACVDDNILL